MNTMIEGWRDIKPEDGIELGDGGTVFIGGGSAN